MMEKLLLDDNGQGLVEYALIISFVVIIVIATLATLGQTLLDTYYNKIINEWPSS